MKQLPMVLVLFVVLFTSSCANQNTVTPEEDSLPGIGAFLWDSQSGVYQQMFKGRGGPSDTGIPATENTLPVIGLNEGNLSDVEMYLVRGDMLDGNVELSRSQKGGHYELVPMSELAPGRYCLVEGNPQRSFYDHPWWCLDIVSAAVSAVPVEGPSEEDLSITPSREGFFLVIDGKPIAIAATDDISGAVNVRPNDNFLTAAPSPFVIAVTTLPVPAQSLVLSKASGGIGVNFENRSGYVTVTRVHDEMDAKRAGLQSGDIILAVDGVNVGGDTDLASSLLQGPVNTTTSVTILRGTQSFDTSITRKILELECCYGLQFTPKTDHVQLVAGPLEPGIYCINEAYKKPSYCFKIISKEEAEQLSAQRAETTPQFAEQPATDEQATAADVLSTWLKQELYLDFRNVRFETYNDGSLATVVMNLETWDPDLQAWLESSASVQLRHIGGQWVADEESKQLYLSPAGQATVEAIQSVTRDATFANEVATQEAIQANLGGTFIYTLDGGKRVAIHKPDGSKATLALSSAANDEYGEFDNLKLAPSGDGFYYSADTDFTEPAIFYSDLSGQDANLIAQFGGQTYIRSMDVSPDGATLAVSLGGFTSPAQVWLFPTNGGEGRSIWESSDYTPEISWAADSSSLYVSNLQFDYYDPTQGTIENMSLDGVTQTIGELPPESVVDDFSSIEEIIAVSPDGKDVAFGGGLLGVLSIDSGANFILSQVPPVCNPTWSQDGSRLLYTSGGSVLVLDVNTGGVTNPLTLTDFETDYNGFCPRSFDWLSDAPTTRP